MCRECLLSKTYYCNVLSDEIKCGTDEVYDGCINGGCGRSNCSQIGQPQICIDLIEGACIPGCRCKPGYLRNDDGKCVPVAKCPRK